MTGRWFIKSGLLVRTGTYSWVLVRNFVDCMVNTRQIARLISASPSSHDLPSGAGIGDAVEYDWNLGWVGEQDPTIRGNMRARVVHVRVR